MARGVLAVINLNIREYVFYILRYRLSQPRYVSTKYSVQLLGCV